MLVITRATISMRSDEQKQIEVKDFWNEKPCDSDVSKKTTDSKAYYLEIESDRYKYQHHINDILDHVDWKDKSVLEIGTGVGTDARNIIRRGGIYTGMNVDKGSVELTRKALKVFGKTGKVIQCSATDICLDSDSVDIVYSFGVLHHIPDVSKAVEEIKRILKPGGQLLIMLYNRDSINYKIEIRILRKILLGSLSLPGVIGLFSLLGLPKEKLIRHREIYRKYGQLDDQEWLNRNTDGPDNPYSLVYSEEEANALLEGMQIVSNDVYFFDYRHWGFLGRLLPAYVVNYLGKRWGWHRVVLASKPEY